MCACARSNPSSPPFLPPPPPPGATRAVHHGRRLRRVECERVHGTSLSFVVVVVVVVVVVSEPPVRCAHLNAFCPTDFFAQAPSSHRGRPQLCRTPTANSRGETAVFACPTLNRTFYSPTRRDAGPNAQSHARSDGHIEIGRQRCCCGRGFGR